MKSCWGKATYTISTKFQLRHLTASLSLGLQTLEMRAANTLRDRSTSPPPTRTITGPGPLNPCDQMQNQSCTDIIGSFIDFQDRVPNGCHLYICYVFWKVLESWSTFCDISNNVIHKFYTYDIWVCLNFYTCIWFFV